jgi:hypothetical protein
MSFYPFNHKMGQEIQTDVSGVTEDRAFAAHFQVLAAKATAEGNAAIHAAITLADGATTVVTTAITQPTVPRCLLVKGNAAGVAGNVVIEGTNYKDEAITETIVAADATVVRGAKAFKTVTKITAPARTAPGDTISIGATEILGLPYLLTHNTVLKTYVDNTLEATPPTVTVSATAIESNTFDTNTALSGKVVDIYLLV